MSSLLSYLKQIFVSDLPDHHGLSIVLRTAIVMGAVWISLEIFDLQKTYPPLEEVDIYKGKVVDSGTKQIRRTTQRYLTLDTGNGKLEFSRYAREENKFFEDLINSEAKVWVHQVPVRLHDIDYIAEISVDGKRLLNDWDLTRQRHSKYRENAIPRMLIVFVGLIILPLFLIIRFIYKRNDNRVGES